MSLLNERYYFEERLACVCKECGRFADIPSTIVHSPKCSEVVLGAHLTPRAADGGCTCEFISVMNGETFAVNPGCPIHNRRR
jgi:hypothetical protein